MAGCDRGYSGSPAGVRTEPATRRSCHSNCDSERTVLAQPRSVARTSACLLYHNDDIHGHRCMQQMHMDQELATLVAREDEGGPHDGDHFEEHMAFSTEPSVQQPFQRSAIPHHHTCHSPLTVLMQARTRVQYTTACQLSSTALRR